MKISAGISIFLDFLIKPARMASQSSAEQKKMRRNVHMLVHVGGAILNENRKIFHFFELTSEPGTRVFR